MSISMPAQLGQKIAQVRKKAHLDAGCVTNILRYTRISQNLKSKYHRVTIWSSCHESAKPTNIRHMPPWTSSKANSQKHLCQYNGPLQGDLLVLLSKVNAYIIDDDLLESQIC